MRHRACGAGCIWAYLCPFSPSICWLHYKSSQVIAAARERLPNPDIMHIYDRTSTIDTC